MNDTCSGADVQKAKIKYISADSHFCEPENFYTERLPKNI